MRKKLKSIQFKMFAIMSILTLLVVFSLILANDIVLEGFYKYSKAENAEDIRNRINQYYNEPIQYNIKDDLHEIEIKNNLDIYIEDATENEIYLGNKQMAKTIEKIKRDGETKTIYRKENYEIKEVDSSNFNKSMILVSKLDNGYMLYIKIAIMPIKESVEITNKALMAIGFILILLSAFVSSIISKKFTDPIIKLTSITEKMSKLDFSEKYEISNSSDEINTLGNNINKMSDRLERTIEQLRRNNDELEKSIEEKSKIDEMRKQFISDVSHELKTPIGLIQGYAEGLIENVNEDSESRKFYAEVIQDEANKMDIMVKRLLELMKLEYQERNFVDSDFDLYELINEEVRRQTIHLKENKITIKTDKKTHVMVKADQGYIEQVLNNYITNAIKNCEKINGEKIVEIRTEETEEGKIRLYVFNTGKNIPKEKINKIWGRFYKIDSARSRDAGGTGIGLALVKAIMNNYHNKYGITNLKNGVEFYCDINKSDEGDDKKS